MKQKIVAALSAISVAAGTATIAFAMVSTQQALQAQGADLLPAAQTKWVESSTAAVQASYSTASGTFLGTLSIPSIKKTINIFQGTDAKTLTKGVGHYLQSVMPGAANNSVLAGHRDTVFSNLGRVRIGAEVKVTTQSGIFIYIVKKIRIVDKSDRTVIVPTPEAQLTLSTCYPFRYVGSAPKRYVVVATLK